MLKPAREKLLAKLLYIGVPFISVFVVNETVTDPVNAPKFLILGAIAFGCSPILFLEMKNGWLKQNFTLVILSTIFILVSLFVLLSSNAPLTQSLYGVYGRNNGFLSYIFLVVILLSAALLSQAKSYEKLLWGLVAAGLVNVIYCGWVLAFGDFMSWSNPYGNILGTFGNPNFIGAFLGIFSTVWFAILFSGQANKWFKFSSIIVLPLTLFEIIESAAIQGRVLFAGGLGIVLFFWLRFRFQNRVVTVTYVFLAIATGVFAIAGALQRGPLTEIVYKTSVSLRGQYWLAGWNTGQSQPFTGVGFDAFGDWYRRMRDLHALTLPGPNTVVNTAHNVPLDLFAFGGWPLLASYLGLMAFVSVKILARVRTLQNYDWVFIALSASWACYQVQSLISINQIGLAVWGWALSGAVIGYLRFMDSGSKSLAPKNSRGEKIEIFSPSISVWIGLVIGGLIAAPPISADLKWRDAQRTRSVAELEKSLVPAYLNPQNSNKYVNSIRAFEESGFFDLARKYALQATDFNPENYDSWRALYVIQNSTEAEKLAALENLKRLDPLNPDVESNQ
jgi:hypothetical protein